MYPEMAKKAGICWHFKNRYQLFCCLPGKSFKRKWEFSDHWCKIRWKPYNIWTPLLLPKLACVGGKWWLFSKPTTRSINFHRIRVEIQWRWQDRSKDFDICSLCNLCNTYVVLTYISLHSMSSNSCHPWRRHHYCQQPPHRPSPWTIATSATVCVEPPS